ncbi:hypothetical protein BDR26DRAFT_78948 [Obelidium mucronatum]|nr:hypothetical protein BDR26DRAFT_78948 [Obelidium mucronatum]
MLDLGRYRPDILLHRVQVKRLAILGFVGLGQTMRPRWPANMSEEVPIFNSVSKHSLLQFQDGEEFKTTTLERNRKRPENGGKNERRQSMIPSFLHLRKVSFSNTDGVTLQKKVSMRSQKKSIPTERSYPASAGSMESTHHNSSKNSIGYQLSRQSSKHKMVSPGSSAHSSRAHLAHRPNNNNQVNLSHMSYQTTVNRHNRAPPSRISPKQSPKSKVANSFESSRGEVGSQPFLTITMNSAKPIGLKRSMVSIEQNGEDTVKIDETVDESGSNSSLDVNRSGSLHSLQSKIVKYAIKPEIDDMNTRSPPISPYLGVINEGSGDFPTAETLMRQKEITLQVDSSDGDGDDDAPESLQSQETMEPNKIKRKSTMLVTSNLKKATSLNWFQIVCLLPAFDGKGKVIDLELLDQADTNNVSLFINGLHPKSFFNTIWDFIMSSKGLFFWYIVSLNTLF